jgi:hypothetical protein
MSTRATPTIVNGGSGEEITMEHLAKVMLEKIGLADEGLRVYARIA